MRFTLLAICAALAAVLCTVGAPLHADRPIIETVAAADSLWGFWLPSVKPAVRIISGTQAEVSWRTWYPSQSKIEFGGVIPPFDRERPISRYTQAIVYAPEGYGSGLSPQVMDNDLRLIRMANANAINLYGLSGSVLARRYPGCTHGSLQNHLLNACRQLGLRVIARIEDYDRSTFAFRPEDVDWVMAHYAGTFAGMRTTYSDVLQWYVLNLPCDDTSVQDNLRRLGSASGYPSAERLRRYVSLLRGRIAKAHPGAKVWCVEHFGALDGIPLPPLADLCDGLALLQYPVRCNTSPFYHAVSGVATSCAQSPRAGDGPSLSDSAHVVIGADQLNYWMEKTAAINGLMDSSRLVFDGVGFADHLTHYSGICADLATKVQATKWLAEYLRTSGQTSGYSYFMLNSNSEGSFGIAVPPRVERDQRVGQIHNMVLRDLCPGAKYTLQVLGALPYSEPIQFQMPDPCPGPDFPRITVTDPGYGGATAQDHQYQVHWTSNLPAGTAITLFADPNDRGLDGEKVGEGVVQPDGGGSAVVNLSGLARGGYHIYATASVSHCSAPGGLIWAYSAGRVIDPAGVLLAFRATGPIRLDGILSESDWSNPDHPWTVFAAHKTGTTAGVRLLWDDDYLYVAFDVEDRNLETDGTRPWDGDSVSLWLWSGVPPGSRTDLPGFIGELRQGVCRPGDVSNIWGESAWAAKAAGTCDDSRDQDIGFMVEMRIPWEQIHTMPIENALISADLLSVSHECGPGLTCCDGPGCPWSKIFWDGDGTGDWLGGAIQLRTQ